MSAVKIDTLLLTPLLAEARCLRDIFSSGLSSVVSYSGGKSQFILNDHILLAPAGHGKVDFALGTQQLLLQHRKTRRVLCLGAGGALVETLQICDVVVGKETITHDHRLAYGRFPAPPAFQADAELLLELASVPCLSGVMPILGTIASGDEDVVSKIRAGEIQKQTGAIAVAWEGSGGARACQRHQTPYAEIRVITDNCNDRTTDDFSMNFQLAMQTLGSWMLRVLHASKWGEKGAV